MGIQSGVVSSLAFLDVPKTMALGIANREGRKRWIEEGKGPLPDFFDTSIGVLDESGMKYAGPEFLEHCIIVGIEAVERIQSQNGDCGAVSKSEEQIKAEAVSNLFEKGNENALFPMTMKDQYVTEATMMILIDLGGFGTDVWKESKDEMLTLKWFAERIVEMFVEIINSANSSFRSDWE